MTVTGLCLLLLAIGGALGATNYARLERRVRKLERDSGAPDTEMNIGDLSAATQIILAVFAVVMVMGAVIWAIAAWA